MLLYLLEGNAMTPNFFSGVLIFKLYLSYLSELSDGLIDKR